MSLLDCAIQPWPTGEWVVVVNGKPVPLLFASRAEGVNAARWLCDKHTDVEKRSANGSAHESRVSA